MHSPISLASSLQTASSIIFEQRIYYRKQYIEISPQRNLTLLNQNIPSTISTLRRNSYFIIFFVTLLLRNIL